MYGFSFKNWFHNRHVPSRPDMAIKLSPLVHHERFWLILFVLAFVGFIVGIAIWAAVTGQPGPSRVPYLPYYY
jgi:hypothetical protein